MTTTTATKQVRLISAAAAAVLSLGLVSAISQQLHISRMGIGLEVVRLAPVSVIATAPATGTAFAAAGQAVQTN